MREPRHESRPRRLGARRVYRGDFLSVFRDKVLLPGGMRTELDRIDHPAAVAVIPVLADGRVILIRQWRATIQDYLWELPAGKLARGESERAGGIRELREETGYRASRMRRVCAFYPAPGFSTEWMTLFVASGLTLIGAAPDPDEVIRVHACTRVRVAHLLRSGAIKDGKSLIGLLAWLGAWVPAG